MNIWRSLASNAVDLLFVSDPFGRGKIIAFSTATILVLVYFSGLLHWAMFLSFGTGVFAGEWGERSCVYGILREALREQVVPYVSPNASCIVPYSERFLGNLQPNLSPQVAFLLLLGERAFILLNILFMYTLGFLGCLLIFWRYRLALLPFSVIFLLFNFNGNITSHISFGDPWNGYFLIPFFVFLVLELVRPEQINKLGPSILLAFVLFGIILQGSFHIYAMCAVFLIVMGAFNRNLVGATLFTLGASVALSLFRFLPAMFVYGGTKTSYASGFPTFSTFVDALTTIKAFTYEHSRDTVLYDVTWKEHDTFIGYIGVAFVVFFGVYLRFRESPSLQRFKFQSLDLPILLVVLFSFGIVTDIISDMRIPFFSWAERVPSRFFVLPLVFLVVIGAIRMQAFVSSVVIRPAAKFLLVAGTVVMAHSLAAHSWFWKLPDQPGATLVFGAPDAAGSLITSPASQDALYIAVANGGAIASLLAIVALCSLYYWKVIRSD